MALKKEELLAELKKMSKRANQRLVRLERNLADPNRNKAYYQAEKYLGEVRTRFKYNKSMSYNEMQRELKYINRFLKSESSTIAGMKRVVKKSYKTLNDHFDLDNRLKRKDSLNRMYNFLNSEKFKMLSETLPSDIILNDYLDNPTIGRYNSKNLKKYFDDLYEFDALSQLKGWDE